MIKNKAVKNIITLFLIIALNVPIKLSMSDYRIESLPETFVSGIIANGLNIKSDTDNDKFITSLSKYFFSNVMPQLKDDERLKSEKHLLYSAASISDTLISETTGTAIKASGDYHNGNPTVVIYHTHTTESYLTDPSSNIYRSENSEINMLSIGHTVSKILYENFGVETLLLTEIYDQPYDSAYEKSYDAVSNAIEKYPSIKYAFDLHRDGLENTEENYSVYSTEINGTPMTKIMMVLGTKADHAQANINFAYQVRDKLLAKYPQLYKNTLERAYRYNQSLADISVLFEIGSNLSTPQEAQNTAHLLSEILAETIAENENVY